MTFWVPTHAPQLLVTRPGSVSTFLSYNAHGSPLGVTLSWVVSVPGVSEVAWVLHMSGYSSLVLGIWPWSHLSLLFITCSDVLRSLTVLPPPRSFLPMGIGGWHRRCLNLATPHLGDASSWRRLKRSTCWLSSHWSPWGVPPYVDFEFGQCPGTGRYKINKSDEIWRKLTIPNFRISTLGFLKHWGDGRLVKWRWWNVKKNNNTVSESQN